MDKYDCLHCWSFCSHTLSSHYTCRSPRLKAWQTSSQSLKRLPRNSTSCGEAEREVLEQVWHHNLLCLLVLLCFTSCLVSTNRVCECVTRFYLSTIFPEEARTLQPHSWHSHRVAYSRCTLHLDVHTNNTFRRFLKKGNLFSFAFSDNHVCICKCISSAF